MTAAMGSPDILSQKRTNSLPRPEPFPHQVAGQSLMLRYDQTTMCKSLTPREHSFYQAMPVVLTQFVPEYRGVVHLYLPDSDNGDCPPCPQECICWQPHNNRPYPSRPLTIVGWPPKGAHLRVGGVDTKISRSLRKTFRTRLDRGGYLYFFLLLEDIMSPFRYPCVLDLKIGTRQHGDDAPAEKVAYQVNKCQNTTSAALGIRLCGMKRYVVTTDQYEVKDKYFGRQLLEEEVKSVIANFFFNGQDFRLEVVAAIISRLEQLQAVIQSLDGHRFYSSSLLIVYEGAMAVPDAPDKPQPHGCSVNKFSSPVPSSFSGHDDLGLNCYPSDLESRPPPNNPDSLRDCDSLEEQSACEDCVLSEGVDIRVVDFAHSTFQGFCTDTVVHPGPDHGFLLGIRTLLDVFRELNNKHRCTEGR